MIESVYKGAFGWAKEDEKHPGTHRLMTNDDYMQLIKEKKTGY